MVLIDRKKLEEQIKEAFKGNPGVMGMLLHWIRRQKAVDAVPVVRCGECVHCRDGMYGQECEEWGIYNDCCYTELDWWCSKGERRSKE